MKAQNPAALCEIALVPVRSQPYESAEMLTQLLFGECFEMLEDTGPWVRIRNISDEYEGWVDAKVVRAIDEKRLALLEKEEILVQPHPIIHADNYQGHHLILPAGAQLTGVKGKSFRHGDMIFRTEVELAIADKGNRASIVETALSFQGAPYLWGGKSILGMDCSGLVQLVFSIHGIALPRDSRQQVNAGNRLESLDDLAPGDLCFFDHENDIISHAGIYIGQNRIIHSSGSVRVDILDEKGIYDESVKKYIHRFRQAKNVVD